MMMTPMFHRRLAELQSADDPNALTPTTRKLTISEADEMGGLSSSPNKCRKLFPLVRPYGRLR